MASYTTIGPHISIERQSDSWTEPCALLLHTPAGIVRHMLTTLEMQNLGYICALMVFKRTGRVPLDPAHGRAPYEPPALEEVEAKPHSCDGCDLCLDECDGSCL